MAAQVELTSNLGRVCHLVDFTSQPRATCLVVDKPDGNFSLAFDCLH
jgi:hypothetical protein